MTLNETWESCIAMWDMIIKILDAGGCLSDESGNPDIDMLKEVLLAHGPNADAVSHCVFCQYAEDNYDGLWGFCGACPGRAVDPDFYCMDEEHNYYKKPHAFYAKLVEMNKIRLELQ